ncbi:DUF721 domain-containing protein [Actinomyces urinae]|uniref:DUF721 domain-containing protein n=1 Tax=Actinomyces urinae TaxID=1689268 RepID=UPI000930AAC5|nr:DciA family protein [Actinomyces urinae]
MTTKNGFEAQAASYAQEAVRRQKQLAQDSGYYPQTAAKVRLLSERGGKSRASSFRTKGDGSGRSSYGHYNGGSKEGLATSKLGTGPSKYDPQPVDNVIGNLVNRLGWSSVLNIATIAARWPSIVGASVAQHCKVETFEDNVLVVKTSSTAWANQMKLLLPTLEKQIAQAFGENAVKRVIIRGPQAPSWRKGRLHVPGRGPRDTYG